MQQVRVFAPATVANLIVGFDTLGAAVQPIDGSLLGDIVTVKHASKNKLKVSGEYKKQLPENSDDNLVMHCVDAFNKLMAEKKMSLDTLSLHLEKGLPICSGLGSSSASIVATLSALNAYYDYPFSDKSLLLVAAKMEGVVSGSAHYDNVAPAIFGGLQLMIESGKVKRLPWFDELLLVIYYPGIKVSTKAAREILPKSFDFHSIVEYGQRLAGFVDALYSRDKQQAMALLFDDIIQPHRGRLIPAFEAGRKSALEAGALAFGISGSGPTCFAIADSIQVAEQVSEVLVREMSGEKTAFSKIVKVADGARLIEK